MESNKQRMKKLAGLNEVELSDKELNNMALRQMRKFLGELEDWALEIMISDKDILNNLTKLINLVEKEIKNLEQLDKRL